MKYLVLFLLITTSCFSEVWVQYDTGTNAFKRKYNGDGVKLGICSVNNTNIQAGWLLDPDLSALSGIPTKYWKQSGGTMVEMTQAEKDAVDAAEQAAIDSQNTTNINNLDISVKDAFIAWLQVYNSKVPAQYQVSNAELKQQVLTNAGL